MEGKYLITTDQWFIAPDGEMYQAVWGEVEIITDAFLGIKTNARSTNWFAKVGTPDRHVIVAGCQIHYAVKCPEKPSVVGPQLQEMHEGKLQTNTYKTRIFITDHQYISPCTNCTKG